jgi:Holliday junction resolvase RusA-like endonuclease
MVFQRELQNIGRLKQDEQDLAVSRTRQKRTSRVAPKYTFDYQEEEAADLAVAEEPASHKRKRSSNAPVKITFKVEKPKRRRRSTASKPVPSLDGNVWPSPCHVCFNF